MATLRANISDEPQSARSLAEAQQELTLRLLLCGVVSSLLYVAMLVGVPWQWIGYSSASRTVSELSAIGAPTRSLWNTLGLVWTALYIAFGGGVWLSAGGSRALRVAGASIVAAGIFGVFWPPMHQREVLAVGGGSLTDTLHLAWTAVNALLTLVAMGFGAAALGPRFMRFSGVSMAIVVVAGVMTSRGAPGVEANLPTPWIGVWERVNLGAWLLWVLVLAAALTRRVSRNRDVLL